MPTTPAFINNVGARFIVPAFEVVGARHTVPVL
jgi:hypothetical protein